MQKQQGAETRVNTQKNRQWVNPPKKTPAKKPGKKPTPNLIQFRIW